MEKYITHYRQLYRKSSTLTKAFFWGGVLLVAIMLFFLIAGSILQGLLPNKLKKAVAEKSQQVYNLSFADMQVDVLGGSIGISTMELTPDTAAYSRLDSIEQSSFLFKITADYIRVSGIDIVKLIFSNKVDVGYVTIQNPKIALIKMSHQRKKKVVNIYAQIPQVLKGSSFGRIEVKKLSFQKIDHLDSSQNSGQLSGVSFQVIDLLLDSIRLQDTSYAWFARDIRLVSENLNYFSPDSLYAFKIKTLRGSTKDKVFSMDSLRVIPRYPEMEFSRKLGKQGDRYQMVFGRITASDIRFKELELENRLSIRSVVLAGNSIKVFRNKAIPEIKIDKTLNFPHIAFKRLKLPLTSDTVLIKNTEVYYKELNPNSGKAGTVFFTNLRGTLLNVSNDSTRWKINHWCRSTFTANFLGKPTLNLTLNLDLSDKDASFNYKGTLGSASASLYNQLLGPLALANVENGIIHRTTFNVQANRFGSNAVVTMLYNDLKISILGKTSEKTDVNEKSKKTAVGKIIAGVFGTKKRKEPEVKTLERKDVVSLLANAVIKTDNPSMGESPRTATIDYKHPTDKSFFNLMWKSIFTGLKDNLGVSL